MYKAVTFCKDKIKKPLIQLIYASICNKIPYSCKRVKVRPIYKKADVFNYGPISLLFISQNSLKRLSMNS